jgi:cytochrome P450
VYCPSCYDNLAYAHRPGGILQITLFGQPLIILNSAAIMDEFDKASAIYSDRPVLQMSGELVGYNETLVLLRYGPRFRNYRKHISRHFGGGKPIQAMQPAIAQETSRFLKGVMADPENLNEHLRK